MPTKRRRLLSRLIQPDRFQKHARKHYFSKPRLETLERRQLLAAEVEPNDVLADATLMAANLDGEVASGRISDSSDVDHFRFSLDPGESAFLRLEDPNTGLFTNTLPPGVEILDINGNVVASSFDGRDVVLTGGSGTDVLYARVTGENVFGGLQDTYGIEFFVFELFGELPLDEGDNATLEDANNLNFTPGIQGNGAGPSFFFVDAEEGEALAVATYGLQNFAPDIEILDGDGNVISTPGNGGDATAIIPEDGRYYIRVESPEGIGPEPFAISASRLPEGLVIESPGSSFDDATPLSTEPIQQTILASFESLDDVHVYQFEIDDLFHMEFEFGNFDHAAASGKQFRLFNEMGQFVSIDYLSFFGSFYGRGDTETIDAVQPGKYFLEVTPTDIRGLDNYALVATKQTNFSLNRDRTTHYIDFDSNESYLGFDRVAAYGDQASQEFYVNVFESRFSPFEVNVITDAPSEFSESVSSGVGDFGNIGAGGFGSGRGGVRSQMGLTVNAANEQSVDFLFGYSTTTLNHEFGHGVGLPHARDVRALMSYVGSTQYVPTGDVFSFLGTDSRRPGRFVMDARDYLDWKLQPGKYLYVSETEESDPGGSVSLDRGFVEQAIDFNRTDITDTQFGPDGIVAGDFNNDGIDDVVVVTPGSNSIQQFLGSTNQFIDGPIVQNFQNLGRGREMLTSGDFDGDDLDDYALIDSGNNEAVYFIQNDDGTFRRNVIRSSLGQQNLFSLHMADLNGDGRMEAIASLQDRTRIEVFALAGDEDQLVYTDSRGVFSTGEQPDSIATGDFDGDGDLEIVTGNFADGSLTILDLSSDLTSATTFEISIGEEIRSVEAADFDGDSRDEVVVALGESRQIQIFDTDTSAGGGIGTMGLVFASDVRSDVENLTVADVNDDSHIDILTGGQGFASHLFLGDGTNTFTEGITLLLGSAPEDVAVGDFDGDGQMEIAGVNRFDRTLTTLDIVENDPTNDVVIVVGQIDDDDDSDAYTLDVRAGERYRFDIDAAEFQSTLDSALQISTLGGALIAESDNAIDGNSGFESVDPFIDVTFDTDQTIEITVLTVDGSVGDYRLKVTPERAFDNTAPRIYAATPESGSTIDSTNQITLHVNDQLDPATLTPENVVVTGENTGVQDGSIVFNPLDATLIWTAASGSLAPDDYTVTLRSDAATGEGVSDLFGNLLDGETIGGFDFPSQTGDGTAGGEFSFSFTIDVVDDTVIEVFDVTYERGPYSRSRITLRLTDQIDLVGTQSNDFSLVAAGADGVLDTADDTVVPLNTNFESFDVRIAATLNLYSLGIVDSNDYRLRGEIIDDNGAVLALDERIVVSAPVPTESLFTTDQLDESGVTGTYIDSNLRDYQPIDDWRVSQTVAGTRVDPNIAFSRNDFGLRSEVGLTSGFDDDWEAFSVQWDGYVVIPEDGVRLLTRSNNSSRLLVDLDGDGEFEPNDGELFDNSFGTFQFGTNPGITTDPLAAGTYAFRVQYEEETGGNEAFFDWILPDRLVFQDGFAHGPSITGTSIRSGEVVADNPPQSIDIQFSGNIDPATLTSDSLRLRRSPDPIFFDGNDTFLTDTDGTINFDPSTLTASIDVGTTLINGFYLIEASGEEGGIADFEGFLLDGENLDTQIVGNTNPFFFGVGPSGDGVAGGTFRQPFSVSNPSLEMVVEDSSISERGGQTLVTLRRRFASVENELVVTLGISDATELTTATTSLAIPAGQDSITFVLEALDDDLLDGTQLVEVTATATGLISNTETIEVLDYEVLTGALSVTSITEAGGQTLLTLSRLDSTDALNVVLTPRGTNTVSVSSVVSFEAGESEITIPVTAIDNSILDGQRTETIDITADGYVPTSVTFFIEDSENLLFELDSMSLREDGEVITGRLLRTDPSGAATAALFNTSGQVSLPSTVNFIDGQVYSEVFEVSGNDNNLLDGSRLTVITAQLAGYVEGSVSLEVTDYEPLELIIAPTSISENGGVATARLRRNDPGGAMTAQIFATDRVNINVPDTVTFVAGQEFSSPFNIEAIDNDLLDGTRIIDLTVVGLPYDPGSAQLEITDFEEMTLEVLDGVISEDSGEVRFRLTRAELGPRTEVTFDSSRPRLIQMPDSVQFDTSDRSVEFVGTILDNLDVEEDANVIVGATNVFYAIEPVSFVVLENDVPEMSLTLPTRAGEPESLVEDGTRPLLATLTRNTRMPLDVMISVSDIDGIDIPTMVSFPANVTEVRFPIRGINNDVVDGDRIVTISATSTGHPTANADLQVIDDERAGVIVLNSPSQVSEGQNDQPITVMLSGRPQDEVVIRLNYDLNQMSSTIDVVTFDASNWNRPQTLRIGAIDDVIVEGNREDSISIGVDEASSHDSFAGLDPEVRSINLIDNDIAGIEIVQSNDETILVGLDGEDTLEVMLSNRPEGNVTVVIDNELMDVVGAAPSSLVFTPDDWNTPQTVVVAARTGLGSLENFAGRLDVYVDVDQSVASFAGAGQRSVGVVLSDAQTGELLLSPSNGQIELKPTSFDRVFQFGGLTDGQFDLSNVDDVITVTGVTEPGVGLETRGGNDLVILDRSPTFRLDTGEGIDTLKMIGPGSDVSLVEALQAGLTGFEVIDLTDANAQVITLVAEGLLPVGDSSVPILIRLGDGDAISGASEFVAMLPELRGQSPVHRFLRGQEIIHVQTGSIYQNPMMRMDVDRSGMVSALDALTVINRLTSTGEEDLDFDIDQVDESFSYVDVNGDGRISALDALLVINALNSQDDLAASGEATVPVRDTQVAWVPSEVDDAIAAASREDEDSAVAKLF
ncbi:MAG: FG-GAP-like repeat-containing protein [Planctomycetota bacterium]